MDLFYYSVVSTWITSLPSPLTVNRMCENWAARGRQYKKPRTCRRKAEIATLRRRHFVSPGVKKPTWKAPAWIFSFIWSTFNPADQHRAPKIRFAWYVHTELTGYFTEIRCVLLFSYRPGLATQRLVYIATRHFEEWARFDWRHG